MVATLSPPQTPSIQSFDWKKLLVWNEYLDNATCEGNPVIPSPKQLAFMLLPHEEALYGGAAGGGKSVALLMDAVRYCHLPNWSAILLRRHLTDLTMEGALLDIAHEWLDPWKPYGVTFRVSTSATKGPPYSFNFPSGATLSFGYWADLLSYQRYQGARFNYVGIDEFTQWPQVDSWMYHPLYLMSRMRRSATSNLPLKFRAATNPGGPGHMLCKERYKIHKKKWTDPHTGEEKEAFVGGEPERPFISAKLSDNTGLDQQSYLRSLLRLDKVTRNQLLHGDWDIASDGRFKPEWFPTYRFDGDFLIFTPREAPVLTDLGGRPLSGDSLGIQAPVSKRPTTIHRSKLTIFFTIDPAASVREGVASATFYERRPPSYSVCAVWATDQRGRLFLLEVLRVQVEIPELFQLVTGLARKHRPDFVAIETNGPGIGPYQMLCRLGIPCKPLTTLQDKVSNAITASVIAEAGNIYLPDMSHYSTSDYPWLQAWKDEVFFWTGHPHDPDDQIDTLSNAAHEVADMAILPMGHESGRDMLPTFAPAILGGHDPTTIGPTPILRTYEDNRPSFA